MSDDDLTALRTARSEAWNNFISAPSEETKAQYKAAQSAYMAARSHAPESSAPSWGPPPDLPEKLDKARLAANAASRAMYANPSEETREASRLARNYYRNLRQKLDPQFKAKRAAANKNWRDKNKLSLPPEP
jgi:hypothetical protein